MLTVVDFGALRGEYLLQLSMDSIVNAQSHPFVKLSGGSFAGCWLTVMTSQLKIELGRPRYCFREFLLGWNLRMSLRRNPVGLARLLALPQFPTVLRIELPLTRGCELIPPCAWSC